MWGGLSKSCDAWIKFQFDRDCNLTIRNMDASNIPSYASGSAYGFSDKVIDGITVTVNSVILTLVSKVFTASIQVLVTL